MTSCAFLRNRCLMSHATIEKLGLFQTSRISDQASKIDGIWNDIFTDAADFHIHSQRANTYGPVLFELDIELVKNTFTGKVWVTKSNPAKWEKDVKHESRWFVSANDLESYFSYGAFDHMCAFRHCGGKLPLLNHLKRIILDDPKLKTDTYDIDYFSMAYGALKFAMSEGGTDAPIEKRKCEADCSCFAHYRKRGLDTEKLFSPRI